MALSEIVDVTLPLEGRRLADGEGCTSRAKWR